MLDAQLQLDGLRNVARDDKRADDVSQAPAFIASPERERDYRDPVRAPHWSEGVCSLRRCMNRAEVALDGQPLCIDCADDVIEREAAVMIAPRLRELLPEVGDR